MMITMRMKAMRRRKKFVGLMYVDEHDNVIGKCLYLWTFSSFIQSFKASIAMFHSSISSSGVSSTKRCAARYRTR